MSYNFLLNTKYYNTILHFLLIFMAVLHEVNICLYLLISRKIVAFLVLTSRFIRLKVIITIVAINILMLMSHINVVNGNYVLEASCQQVSTQHKNTCRIMDGSFLEDYNLGLNFNFP